MIKSMKEALMHRRSYYAITDKSPVSDAEIEGIVLFASRYVPSAYNSQSVRMVLLLDGHHKKLWNIVRETLRKMAASPEAFKKTEAKIDGSFFAGYGTVLFFEDTDIVRQLQKDNPAYADNFPHWSDQTQGMNQLTVWTLLEDAGFGASLQHYNPLIDNEVKQTWKLPESWKLIAQMPFGLPLQDPSEPDPKEKIPPEERVRIFK